MTVRTRETVEGRAAICDAILRGLPDWFGIEESIRHYVEDVESLPVIVAEVEGEIVGFLAIRRHTPDASEIHVMGVKSSHHRQGVGRALVRAAERHVLDLSGSYLQVKTLSSRRESRAYEATRRFYAAMGFVPLEEMPGLWGPGNPCLVMVKHLCEPGLRMASPP